MLQNLFMNTLGHNQFVRKLAILFKTLTRLKLHFHYSFLCTDKINKT